MAVYRYQTDYANQVQQLLVSVSKHYYVTNDGSLKYQRKNLEATLRNLDKSSKKNLIHFLIRDHYSGVYYAELCTRLDMINIGEFLYRAWAQKRSFEFYGLPEKLMIPQLVVDVWPNVLNLVELCNIVALKPSSGFQSGTVDIKNWEDMIKFYMVLSNTNSYEVVKEGTLEICRKAAHRPKTSERFLRSRNGFRAVRNTMCHLRLMISESISYHKKYFAGTASNRLRSDDHNHSKR